MGIRFNALLVTPADITGRIKDAESALYPFGLGAAAIQVIRQ